MAPSRSGPFGGIDRWRGRRMLPVRRLSRDECDLVGYAAPLVLSEQHMRAVWGPWRHTGWYAIVQHPDRVVWTGSRRELAQLGLEVGTPD